VKLEPGARIRDNLRLLRLIGVGGMGSVWSAQHSGLGTQVAVKFASAELTMHDPLIRERFRREASAAATIKSPHVVQIYDTGEIDGLPFIVMELLEGESLIEWLDEKLLSFRQAAQVVVQVAKALDRAHAAGIVHRDIKPDNIFLSTSDEGRICKVLDFGVAKRSDLPVLNGLTKPGIIVGTPEFLSPEGLEEPELVEPHVDLWSLAVVMFYALTGELPFKAESLATLLVRIVTTVAPAPSTYRADIPPALDAWFAKALAPAKHDRYQSAKELAVAFVKALPQRRRDPLLSGGAFSGEDDDAIEDESDAPPKPAAMPSPRIATVLQTPTEGLGSWRTPPSQNPHDSLSAQDSFDGIEDEASWDGARISALHAELSSSRPQSSGVPSIPGVLPSPAPASRSSQVLVTSAPPPPLKSHRGALIAGALFVLVGAVVAVVVLTGAPQQASSAVNVPQPRVEGSAAAPVASPPPATSSEAASASVGNVPSPAPKGISSRGGSTLPSPTPSSKPRPKTNEDFGF
jgi:eukaryotic-like serine/threonine-protein kinase